MRRWSRSCTASALSAKKGLEFLKEIEKAGILTAKQMEGFCHGNAEKLLKVKIG